jgi:hypothetical protein
MKALLACVLVFGFAVSSGLGEEANGFRLTAQKTLLEKGKDQDAFYQWDKVDKALGIKVAAKNVSLKDLPEGTIEYTVIVKRWGRVPEVLESYTGTEKLPALLKGGEANLIVGKVPLGGWETNSNRKEFQDSIEGWRVVAKHGDKETVKVTSTSSFEKLLAKAKPGPAPKK